MKKSKYQQFHCLHTTILVIIFWDYTMFQQRSDQPQVKQNMRASIVNLVYELPNELPDDLRSQEIGKHQEYLKFGWRHSPVPSAQCPVPPTEKKLWQQLSKSTQKQISNFSCPVQFYCISLFCSKYFAQDYLNKQNFGLNSAQSPSNLIFFYILYIIKAFLRTISKI